jgi:PHP family Zn ribbon phosphoesterase
MNCVLEYITKNPQETKRLIGIDYEQLQQLITQAVALEQQNLATNEEAKIRIIKQGGGRKPKLSVTEQIVDLLQKSQAGWQK